MRPAACRFSRRRASNTENIGVNIDITPRTHHEDEVTLTLRVAVQAISGTGFGGLPTFANREINTQIRLRDGETNMLAGLIRDEERRVLDGIPGLSDIPVVGRIFAHNRTEINQSDIILTLTPHIIRVLDVSEDDLRAFRVGRDSGSSLGGADLPPALDIPLPAPAPAAARYSAAGTTAPTVPAPARSRSFQAAPPRFLVTKASHEPAGPTPASTTFAPRPWSRSTSCA